MKSVIFFHRSVGHNLIRDGGVYDLVKDIGTISFSDYDQNTDVLTLPDGSQQTPGFILPGDNTRPEEYAMVFADDAPITYQPIQDFALQHDMIVIKSCYPNSNIKTDVELAAIKQQYRSIARFFAQYPDKKLLILTSPPLAPLMTKPDRAQRARKLANWLVSKKLADNVTVFDFLDLLADSDSNTLKKDYCRWLPFDSHPNARASREIAPKLVEYLRISVK